MAGEFNTQASDSQATEVAPLRPGEFPYQSYGDYSKELDNRCREFSEGGRGSLVYRRFRVGEVFSSGSGDMKRSLELQLGALAASMDYEADVPNFLEPWYGIGTVASAFGCDYIWHPGQAPATEAPFSSFREALEYEFLPIEETPVGRRTLEMTEYFLEKTAGRIPMSLCDVQSPLNASGYLVDTNNYYLGLYDDPESFMALLERIVDLMVVFYRKQAQMIGDALAMPGHGFASSRQFSGFGMSDDNITMLSPDHYRSLVLPAVNRLSREMGGIVFHSCGNWADKIDVVMEMEGLRSVDGAFSAQTDPAPNPLVPFIEAFSESPVVLNARLVGAPEEIGAELKALAQAPFSTILVTYGSSVQEQRELYTLCGG